MADHIKIDMFHRSLRGPDKFPPVRYKNVQIVIFAIKLNFLRIVQNDGL